MQIVFEVQNLETFGLQNVPVLIVNRFAVEKFGEDTGLQYRLRASQSSLH